MKKSTLLKTLAFALLISVVFVGCGGTKDHKGHRKQKIGMGWM